ncbi:hypothetical protein [Bathymodiolus platifrons methanotrophic gill symbiont]|uniref:hypothetical protein n=1 Tax=Bathymodiolus platifrons methanotrophic gill symbiont TaxID=113268 RepID=UPI001C8DBDB7|nr:hypothetical protein [Bathymodiolus platifrons methanotrophic gill symbiont]
MVKTLVCAARFVFPNRALLILNRELTTTLYKKTISQHRLEASVMSLLQGKGIQPSYLLKKGTDKLFIQHNLFICPLPPQTRGYHYPEEPTHEKPTTQPEVGLTEEQLASYAFKKIWAGGELQPA